MKKDGRIAKRVGFDQGFEITAVAIDGTWTVRGRLNDVSATGAKFRPLSPLSERMQTEEFFLFLTQNGNVSRRSKFVWQKKGLVGLKFVKPPEA